MKKIHATLASVGLLLSATAFAQQPAQPPAGARGGVANMAGAPAAAPVASARVLMLRTFVSDLDRGVKFYHEVFGMTAVQVPGFGGPPPATGSGPAGAARPGGGGGGIRILNFPGGTPPGMIMIKGSGDASMMRGSYVIQVPDLKAALAAAEANGGKVQTTRFTAGGQESRHVLDPDGNDIEVLESRRPN